MEGCLCLRMFLFLFLKRHLFKDNTKRAVNDPQAFSSHDFCLPPVGTLLSFCLVYRIIPLRARSRYTCTLSKLECLKISADCNSSCCLALLVASRKLVMWMPWKQHTSMMSRLWRPPAPDPVFFRKWGFNLGRTWRYKWWEKHPGNFERAGV